MTIWDPIIVQGNGTTPSYSAQELRFGLAAEDWNEGVRMQHHCRVTQRGAGANMSVDVAAGDAVVTGDDIAYQGNVRFRSTAVVNVTGFVAPSGLNVRYDLVVIRLTDANALGSGVDGFTIEPVTGTPATSGAVPPPAPASCFPIAVIGPLVAGTASITNALIHDAHTGTGPAAAATVRLVSGPRDLPGTSKEGYWAIAPSGWALENGAPVSRTANPGTFAVLGESQGPGDGVTTFNLPFSNGRVAVAADVMGGVDAGLLSSSNTIGTKMGAETHTLTQAELPAATITINPPSTALSLSDPGHGHGVTDPGHAHASASGDTPIVLGTGLGFIGTGGVSVTGIASPGTAAATTGISIQGSGTGISGSVDIAPFNSGDLGSGTAHSIMQPSITVNRIICLG